MKASGHDQHIDGDRHAVSLAEEIIRPRKYCRLCASCKSYLYEMNRWKARFVWEDFTPIFMWDRPCLYEKSGEDGCMNYAGKGDKLRG